MRSSQISVGVIAILALMAIPVVPAAAQQHARPHGITITCDNYSCHPNHHRCKRHGKRHKCHHRRSRHPKAGRHQAVVTIVDRPEDTKVFQETLPATGAMKEGEIYEGCDGCELEATDMEVYEVSGFKNVPSSIWGTAQVRAPLGDEVTITFVAKYGSFNPAVYAGSGKINPYGEFDLYEPPCSKAMPADGYDEAWVVVFDRTKHTYAESEHVTFNIEHPENVHEVHPVG